jgi:outer membrane protein assembly factor BamB
MKEKHRIAPHSAAFSFTLVLLLVMTAIFASSCGESSETHSLKATISAQATQLAEIAPPTATRLASPTPPKAAGLASPTPPPPAAKSHAPLVPIWSVSIGNLSVRHVIGGVIVASTSEEYTMGLSRATGEVLWTWELTDPILAKDEMRLYMCKCGVGNRPAPRIYALDLTTGERVWNIDIDTEEAPFLSRSLGSVPDVRLYGGLLYLVRGGQPTEIVAIDASSGEERWVHPFDRWAPYMFLEGVLFIGTGSHQIVGLAPETGEILWGPIDLGNVYWKSDPFLALLDETVILEVTDREDHQSWLVALDVKTGSQEWTIHSGTSSLKAFGNTLLCLTEKSGGKVIDGLTGEVKWAWERDALGVPIGMAGDTLVFSSESRELIYGVDIETGSKLWDMDLQASHSWKGASDRVAIIVSGAGYLRSPVGIYGVDVASGRRIWEVKYADLYLHPKFTDIGPFLVSKTEKGMVVDLIDPVTGMAKWSEQISGRVVSIVDTDDLILIVSEIGEGPRTLSAYEKAH